MSIGKTIRVSEEIYEKLASEGNMKDSFDSVIRKLIDKQKVIVNETKSNPSTF